MPFCGFVAGVNFKTVSIIQYQIGDWFASYVVISGVLEVLLLTEFPIYFLPNFLPLFWSINQINTHNTVA